MLSRDFVTVSDAATVGDAFRALNAAQANMNWHVVVRYADHYGAVQAGQLAQSVIGRGAQAALATRLRDLPIPQVPTTTDVQAQVRRLTIVLERDQAVAVIYDPVRGFFPGQKEAFDQLMAAAVPAARADAKWIEASAWETVQDAFRRLQAANADEKWYIVVRYADHYRAIQAGTLAQALAARTDLATRLDNLDIPAVRNAPQGASIESALADVDSAPANSFSILGLGLAQSAFAAIRDRAITRHIPLRDLEKAGPPSQPSTQETTDERARYVNTWFTASMGGEAFIRERSLARQKPYWVQLHIGPLLRESIIVAPRPIDPDLPPIPDEGLLLRVKLFSRDFDIENSNGELRLLKTGATDRLHFAVAPREQSSDARLRAAVYYKNNLVQSIMLHARVDDQEMKLGRGKRANWAEVEYSLSEDWADVTQLQPRAVSILANESPDGSHMIGVVGTPTEGTLEIGRDKMAEAVTAFRDKLIGICMDDQKRYRYRADNTGDQDKFIEDLKTLAYVGNALFRSVFYRDETIDFTRELRQALAGSPSAVIQIARLSTDFVFPWAGIYDRRLEIDRGKNQVCLEPLKQTTAQAALAACSNCSHGEDRNVICLAGFWGLRHIVEQPLGIVKKDAKPVSTVREIKASGQVQASVNVYVGDDFKLRPAHQDWLINQIKRKNGAPTLADELKEVKAGLPQSKHLCYFYCHGGADEKSLNPWLTVGKDERLVPADLFSIGLEEDWRFSNVRPLVFINACHSIEFTPEALSAFLPEWTTAGASGVIGTEISIFEPLAVEFGQGLIEAFLNGEPIGQAVQRLRWQLLLKRNVLGLVYTPYCYADLRLVA